MLFPVIQNRTPMTMRRTLKGPASLLVLVTILSCDSFKEDFIEPAKQVIFSTTEYYVMPGSSVVIDLQSVIKQSYTNVSLSISQNPLRGTATQLGTLVKYYPSHEFLEGMDQFVFSVLSGGEVIATETITIFMKQKVEELPCPLYAMEDKVYVRSGSTVFVEFLKNDRICGINNSPLQISIHLNPRFGEGKLVGDSIIVYTAGPEYKGRDELVYKLSDSSGENFSYGIINISEWEVQFLPTPVTLLSSLIGYWEPEVTKMFFVNDSTGFLGGYLIYKTTDGGATWKEASIALGASDDSFSISDFYFLDTNHGYASYSGDYEGRLLRTVDGGDTWSEVFQLDMPVSSVFFISSTTGFITTGQLAGNPKRVFQSIFKSDDGGITWNSVFSNSGGFGPLDIRFAASVGYAYDNFTIFTTIDGGESWKFAYDKAYIMSAAVTPENIISANFTSGDFSGAGPSSMFMSRDGEDWSPTLDLPYSILAQEFSVGGHIGFAIGISARDHSVDYPRSQTLSINKSLDKGATWTEVETTEPLYGYPFAVALPSDNVAYVLGFREVIKFTRP
jgi:hypothetical protein